MALSEKSDKDRSDERRDERRLENRDWDTLIRIDANLSNFMRRFDDHLVEDKLKNEKNDDRFEKLSDGQEFLKRYLWIGLGVVAAVEFFARKIFP